MSYEEATLANLKFWSCIAAAGQKDMCSHVESITSTNRIIHFPRGTETIIVYCPPPPLNDGISLLLLHFRGKRESLAERKGRYGTEQHRSHQPTGSGLNREKQRGLSGSLFKPPNHPGLHCVAVKGSRANNVNPRTQSSPAVDTSQHCSSSLKAGTWKMKSNRPLFRPVTLFVMELEVALSWKIVEKKQKG